MNTVAEKMPTENHPSISSAPFTEAEIENLHASDRQAARIIVALLGSVFTVGLILYTYIFWVATQ